MVELTFPDGSKKTFEEGITGLEVAQTISEGLARATVAIKFNDKVIDATKPLKEDGSFQILTFKDPEGQEVFRHSSAHLLAHAIKRLYPEAKPTIGPVVEQGFYYDFDNLSISDKDFEAIEAEMKKIVKEAIPIERIEYSSKEEALEAFIGNPFKEEMIKDIEEGWSAYKQGDFTDLCRGPHVPNTKMIKAVKLLKLAGAYWKGDANNKQLTRIYGISFPDKKELKAHLTLLEEAEKRDHRKLGKELDLFSFHKEAPGMPFFHDKGSYILDTLADFMRKKMYERNYEMNKTPTILNKELWLQSGHWDHYKENMYFTKVDDVDFAIKPMNCPGNILIFNSHRYSYRDLPIRAGEFGLVHRHELSGALSGLFRVRCFTQDDAHVFCTREQIKDEIYELIDFIDEVYGIFGFEYHIELSTRPEKAEGNDDLWELAENTLLNVLKESGRSFEINPGDGAFYGPKLDFHLKDAIGRTWQCGTIQLDFQMPEKFDLKYEGADGKKHRPVMLHRVIYGSFERFLGILIENYAGKLPLWINPNQVKILPIADRHIDYAKEIATRMRAEDIRVEIDTRSETTGKKVRDAQLQQFNYILVVGDKEVSDMSVTIRTRGGEIIGSKDVNEFIESVVDEKNRRI